MPPPSAEDEGPAPETRETAEPVAEIPTLQKRATATTMDQNGVVGRKGCLMMRPGLMGRRVGRARASSGTNPCSFTFALAGLITVALVAPGVAYSGTVIAAAARVRNPPGAVALNKANIERAGNVICGKLRANWTPGTVLASGYFISDAQQAHNYTILANHASGRTKARYLALSTTYAQRAKDRQPVCLHLSDPPGAVKLAKSMVLRTGGFVCGKLRSIWTPGTLLASGYFISDAKQARNFALLARKAKGHAKKIDLAKATLYTKRAKNRQAACTRAGASGTVPPGNGSGPPPTVPTPLRFNLVGSIGLALQSPTVSGAQDRGIRVASDPASNLEAVSAAGQLSDAVTSGSATISHFLIAPNNSVYVVFSSPVDLANTAQSGYPNGCLLAEVPLSSGIPTCVDSTLTMINWGYPVGDDPSQPIQFDNSGAIYYSGTTGTGTTVLRKYLDGATTNLITDSVMLDHFLVLPDGTVIISGTTTSSGARWVRRISAGGSLSGLETQNANFLSVFSDDNVYMGLWGGNSFGVARYLPNSDQIDPEYWISAPMTNPPPTEYFNAQTICSGATTSQQTGFCGWFGSYITWSYQSSDGSEYVAAGASGLGAIPMQYYPTVRFLPSEVTNVTVAQGVGNDLILAGLNSTGKNVLTLYNTTSDTESELIGPSNEIEIYHLNYNESGNKILFDGLRFSDNSYVIGEVDLATDQVSVINTGSTKWADLQAFG